MNCVFLHVHFLLFLFLPLCVKPAWNAHSVELVIITKSRRVLRYDGKMACRTKSWLLAPAQKYVMIMIPQMNKLNLNISSGDICQYGAVADTAIMYLVTLARVDVGAARQCK